MSVIWPSCSLKKTHQKAPSFLKPKVGRQMKSAGWWILVLPSDSGAKSCKIAVEHWEISVLNLVRRVYNTTDSIRVAAGVFSSFYPVFLLWLLLFCNFAFYLKLLSFPMVAETSANWHNILFHIRLLVTKVHYFDCSKRQTKVIT